jgi:Trk-type K+ transport system membrane component
MMLAVFGLVVRVNILEAVLAAALAAVGTLGPSVGSLVQVQKSH